MLDKYFVFTRKGRSIRRKRSYFFDSDFAKNGQDSTTTLPLKVFIRNFTNSLPPIKKKLPYTRKKNFLLSDQNFWRN